MLDKRFIRFALTLCLFAAIGFSMVACGSTQEKESIPSETTTETITQTEPETTNQIAEGLESAKTYIDNALGTNDSFPYHNVEIEQDGLIISYSFSGMGDAADTIKMFPSDSLKEQWSSITDVLIKSHQQFLDVMKKYGVDSAPLTVNLVDDRDTSRLLVSVENGTIVYDIVEDTETDSAESTTVTTPSNANTGTATMGQKNALKSAKNYLSIMGFSRKGLIEQLEYEGYTTEEATYAVNNCGADWNEQAAKSAKSYLDLMGFSRSGLIEQLEYDGYTHEQAVYGAEANGY